MKLLHYCNTYKKTIAWSSERIPRRMYARWARSSAAWWALPSLPPSWPRLESVYVLSEMIACEESCEVGRCAWKRLARWAVKCVSDCRWLGKAGSETCWYCGTFAPYEGFAMARTGHVPAGASSECRLQAGAARRRQKVVVERSDRSVVDVDVEDGGCLGPDD
jgi:hypothetical protein